MEKLFLSSRFPLTIETWKLVPLDCDHYRPGIIRVKVAPSLAKNKHVPLGMTCSQMAMTWCWVEENSRKRMRY